MRDSAVLTVRRLFALLLKETDLSRSWAGPFHGMGLIFHTAAEGMGSRGLWLIACDGDCMYILYWTKVVTYLFRFGLS